MSADEDVTITLPRKKFVRLVHTAICQAEIARGHMDDGNTPASMARYFALDRHELSRIFKMLPEDLQAEILASNEPPGK